jgi:hypothetical protein
MSEEALAKQEASPPEALRGEELAKVWTAVGPLVERVSDAAIRALERSARHTGWLTAALLALIISCLTAVAVYALHLGKIDTAEKIIIALVSFLGGAAMFSGPPKK